VVSSLQAFKTEFVRISHSSMRATCSAHLILIYTAILMKYFLTKLFSLMLLTVGYIAKRLIKLISSASCFGSVVADLSQQGPINKHRSGNACVKFWSSRVWCSDSLNCEMLDQGRIYFLHIFQKMLEMPSVDTDTRRSTASLQHTGVVWVVSTVLA
jgi:hypothetical protein